MFRFRLQRVLELREQSEQEKARALAAAQDAAETARRAQESLAALQANSRAEVEAAQAELPRVGHLQGLGMVLSSIEQRLSAATESVQAADGVVRQAQGELADAARERQILDRLKDKHAETWRGEEAQRDRTLMDEIALMRFGRAANDET